jgi:cytochrome c oxidase assembly protein subunit 15
LSPIKITTHMLAALLIISFQLYLIHQAQKNKSILLFDATFTKILYLTIVLTIIQVLLGTSVREHVDEISETGAPKIFWLQNPSLSFYIHRSFSIIVLLANFYLFFRNRKLQLHCKKINWIVFLIFIEILSGIMMYYLDFPFGTQTIHIVLATLLFGVQFYVILENSRKKRII